MVWRRRSQLITRERQSWSSGTGPETSPQTAGSCDKEVLQFRESRRGLHLTESNFQSRSWDHGMAVGLVFKAARRRVWGWVVVVESE